MSVMARQSAPSQRSTVPPLPTAQTSVSVAPQIARNAMPGAR